jgi:hypothetical protein
MDENSLNGASIQRRRQDANASLYHNNPSATGSGIKTESRNTAEEGEQKLRSQISGLRRDLILAVSIPFLLLLWVMKQGNQKKKEMKSMRSHPAHPSLLSMAVASRTC